ncbi:hypothetical protein [Halobacterium yunchengense]|uniref:hypothetical protein n=1 Tax=Halobacterium yunchengense TaxID=3108497 RepID=UPI00300B46EB
MRQLDTCDFCGDAAEGVYEVVPASVAGEPKRLALCADCRATLQSVVDPLLAAASATGTATADASDDASGEDAADTATADSTDAGDSTSAESPRDADADGTDSEGVTIEVGGRDDADAGGDADPAETEGPSAGGSPARRPSGYAQLIRLLQNRDGAMPREDLRALATNAYDLGDAEFEAAVEAAIENGDVEETAGGLRTT